MHLLLPLTKFLAIMVTKDCMGNTKSWKQKGCLSRISRSWEASDQHTPCLSPCQPNPEYIGYIHNCRMDLTNCRLMNLKLKGCRTAEMGWNHLLLQTRPASAVRPRKRESNWCLETFIYASQVPSNSPPQIFLCWAV